jgi:hypothetical protein
LKSDSSILVSSLYSSLSLSILVTWLGSSSSRGVPALTGAAAVYATRTSTAATDSTLERHEKAKQLYSNVDPKSTATEEMKLNLLSHDEACLVVSDSSGQTKLLVLQSSECWSRLSHSCDYLPPETSENDSVIKDLDENSPNLHTVMSFVIMGDLTMAGCYVD